jgi:hypothetical protein
VSVCGTERRNTDELKDVCLNALIQHVMIGLQHHHVLQNNVHIAVVEFPFI